MSNIRLYLRKLWLADRDGGCNPDDMVFRPTEEIMSDFYIINFVAKHSLAML